MVVVGVSPGEACQEEVLMIVGGKEENVPWALILWVVPSIPHILLDEETEAQ